MKNVLIVDDEERFILSLTAGLEVYKDRFQVLAAENGKKAAAILECTPIDLVVTDLKMPEMDGFELLAYIGSHFPAIPVVVMTAFATGDTREVLKKMGDIRLIEKPIDLDELAREIMGGINRKFRGGSLAGISIGNFLQLIEMEQKTCKLNVADDKGETGSFYFNKGTLYDAVYGDLNGEAAALELIAMENTEITMEDPPKHKITNTIKSRLISLLFKSARRRDEESRAVEVGMENFTFPEKEDASAGEASEQESSDDTTRADDGLEEDTLKAPSKGDEEMARIINELLEKCRDVDGFVAVGVFSAEGELLAEMNTSGHHLGELGALANDVLLKAQKTTELMGVGRGNLVHIQAPKAQILARCLNEDPNLGASTPGKAHIHMILIMGQESNLALGKMKLNGVIQELAPHFR